MDEQTSKQKMSFDKHTYLSIGLFLSLIAGITYNEGRMTALETELSNHIHNPSLHENINQRMDKQFVRQKEADLRFNSIDNKLNRIEENVKILVEEKQ